MEILANIWIGLGLFGVFLIFYSTFSEQYKSAKAEKERKRKQEVETAIRLSKMRDEARIIADKQKKDMQSNPAKRLGKPFDDSDEPFHDFDHSFLDDQNDDINGYMYM